MADSQTNRVLCAGNLVYDILVRPVAQVRWGATTWVDAIEQSMGGNGASTSYTLGKLGVSVRVVGMVGNDAFGEAVLSRLREASVDTSCVVRSRAPTAATVALVAAVDRDAALAVLKVAVLKMSLAVREVSVERGFDPRDFCLVAYGGAGPLHASAVARELHIPVVVVPNAPGQFSAAGMLMADLKHDLVRTVYRELDRAAPQDARAVLERRRAYCTGVARLTVALLESVGVPAREVPGFVLAPPGGGVPAGYHRWVETRYEDVGWVFSDPLLSHHYVPATYVRLASETLRAGMPGAGRLLHRDDRRQAVDLFAEMPPGVTLRRNSPRQRAAALTISVGGVEEGVARLEGGGERRTRPLAGGSGTFLGLEPGVYRLRVDVPGHPPLEKQITLRARVAASVHLPMKETT